MLEKLFFVLRNRNGGLTQRIDARGHQMVYKVQFFGHSFVKHLKTFIKNSTDLSYSLNLPGQDFMIQYTGLPGARVEDLRNNLDNVTDFKPDLLVLIIGTNDLFNRSPCQVTSNIVDLVDTLLFLHRVPKVVVCQTLYRTPPARYTKYAVDIEEFNLKVDQLNRNLDSALKKVTSSLWRLKGFWAEKSVQTAFVSDGVHLSSEGNRKLFKNLRALVVTCRKLQD